MRLLASTTRAPTESWFSYRPTLASVRNNSYRGCEVLYDMQIIILCISNDNQDENGKKNTVFTFMPPTTTHSHCRCEKSFGVPFRSLPVESQNCHSASASGPTEFHFPYYEIITISGLFVVEDCSPYSSSRTRRNAQFNNIFNSIFSMIFNHLFYLYERYIVG